MTEVRIGDEIEAVTRYRGTVKARYNDLLRRKDDPAGRYIYVGDDVEGGTYDLDSPHLTVTVTKKAPPKVGDVLRGNVAKDLPVGAVVNNMNDGPSPRGLRFRRGTGLKEGDWTYSNGIVGGLSSIDRYRIEFLPEA